MSTAKHTPGPWAYIPQADSVYSDIENKFKMPPGDNFVCELGLKNMEANARLIAAAPELYEIVLGLMEYHGPGTCPDHLFEAGNNILRRIEGEE